MKNLNLISIINKVQKNQNIIKNDETMIEYYLDFTWGIFFFNANFFSKSDDLSDEFSQTWSESKIYFNSNFFQ